MNKKIYIPCTLLCTLFLLSCNQTPVKDMEKNNTEIPKIHTEEKAQEDYNTLLDELADEGMIGEELTNDSIQIEAEYRVDQNSISLKTGTADPRDQDIWGIFIDLIPENIRQDVSSYQVVDDAKIDMAAYVLQDTIDETQWILQVNRDAFYKEGVFTPEPSYAIFIHEIAHVITLGKDQLEYYPDTEGAEVFEKFMTNCTTQLLLQGCLHSDSYLNVFIDTFWDMDNPVQYSQSPENFVTKYAATKAEEDIAESFRFFVLEDRSLGDSIADKKKNFFYAYDSMVELRDMIRTRLEALKNT